MRELHHVTEHLEAIHAFPLRVTVRKMDANVALGQRAEHRIDDGVRQHISIGVPFRAEVVRDGNATDDEWPSCDQPVRVIADADAKHERIVFCALWLASFMVGIHRRPQVQSSTFTPSLRMVSANARSDSFVILIFLALPSTTNTFRPRRSTRKLSSVTSIPASSNSISWSYARFNVSNRKHCGVNARRSSFRLSVFSTQVSSSSFIVSVTGATRIAAPTLFACSTVRSISSGVTNGRTPS